MSGDISWYCTFFQFTGNNRKYRCKEDRLLGARDSLSKNVLCSYTMLCHIFSLFSSVTSGFSTWQTWPGCAPAVQHHSLQPVTFEGWKWPSITLWKGGDARLMWLWGAGFSKKRPQAVCSDCRDTPDLLQIFGLGLLRWLKFWFRKGSRFDGTRDKQSNSKAWHHIVYPLLQFPPMVPCVVSWCLRRKSD